VGEAVFIFNDVKKICCRCKEYKPISEFYEERTKSGRLSSRRPDVKHAKKKERKYGERTIRPNATERNTSGVRKTLRGGL